MQTGNRCRFCLPRVIPAALLIGLAALADHPARAEQFPVVTAAPSGLGQAHVAFVDAVRSKRVVEIDRNGNVVWQCSLVGSQFGSDELQRGADLEWIAADDTFLVTVPFSGIFRIDRQCRIVWQHRTKRVSHDADLLANGNVLYTFAWDEPSDLQVVEIDRAGRTVWSWQARDRIDPSWRGSTTDSAGGDRSGDRGAGRRGGAGSGQGGGRGEGFTHTNAVVRLPDGDTRVSLRNFGRVVRVGPDGNVKWASGHIQRVHDPSLLPDGRLVAAEHGRMTVVALGSGRRDTIFANGIGIKPIRTVEQLGNGNFLVTGGEDIVEIDGNGTVLWHVRPYAGLGARIRDGIYKAVRVGR